MTHKIKFFTPVSIVNNSDEIKNTSKILTLGSCFSDNIGNKLSSHLFDTLVNPFGTIFNPVSISKSIDHMVSKKSVCLSDLHMEGNRYFHYDFHSTFDSTDSVAVLDQINLAIDNAGAFLQDTDVLILTFGTSIVYKLKRSDQIVSNCHKVPSIQFGKEFLTVDFMKQKVVSALSSMRKIFPNVKVILTVSPVRHTKEGLVENNLSKSRLVDLCHQLVQEDPKVSYFPAFEIMMDELRDYRFYGPDLIHPNEQAIEIIWNRFMDWCLDENSKQKVSQIGELNRAKNHIPFDPESNEHKRFKENQLTKIKALKVQFPEIDFKEFIQHFQG